MGEIYLVLENETDEEKQSMGRLLKMYNSNWEEVLDSFDIVLE